MARPREATPAWPLPAAIATVLVVATHLAWWLSVRDGHVPACVPYLEGCTSISRAARHGLGNHVFRLLVLPCALLVAAHWWMSWRWLRLHGARGGALLPVLGTLAAIALAVYATFLGSDGEAYRFLRRYGVVVFFGCGYLAQLLFLRRARQLRAVGPGRGTAMAAVCAGMLLLGLGNVAASALVVDPVLKDRIENALEWQLGVLLVAWFALQAALWRRDGFSLRFSLRPGQPAREEATRAAARAEDSRTRA